MRKLLPFVLISAALGALPAAPAPRPSQPFTRVVLGASLFKAAWAYKDDRPWLESQLKWLRAQGFDAIRALGVVGDPSAEDYWDGREIDWRWKDYDEVISGLTDLAYDTYGIRVQWTIFADAQKNTPQEADRAALVEKFVRMSRGRERKILAFEIANEFWQNGFDGRDGVRQLRTYAARLRSATTIPVAASAHADELCPLYAAGVVDFATIHFDRQTPHALWSPLTEPWRFARRPGHFAGCLLPDSAANNEPVGPGSSSGGSPTTLQLVMSAVNTYIAGVPIYIFHSGPGVRDDPAHSSGLRPLRLDQLPTSPGLFEGLRAMRGYVPEDLPAWTSVTADDEAFPFTVSTQAALVMGALSQRRFFVAVSDAERPVELVARRGMSVGVIEPLTGRRLEQRTLAEGQALRIANEAAVLSGTVNR